MGGESRYAAAESGSGKETTTRRRNPGLPLRWTNFSLRVNFAFDKTAHFTFRTSASPGTEIASRDNEQKRNARAKVRSSKSEERREEQKKRWKAPALFPKAGKELQNWINASASFGTASSSNITRDDRKGESRTERAPSELNSFFATAIDDDFAEAEGTRRDQGEMRREIEEKREKKDRDILPPPSLPQLRTRFASSWELEPQRESGKIMQTVRKRSGAPSKSAPALDCNQPFPPSVSTFEEETRGFL
ncbi:hypothetical protein X777_06887 [Ooceraea biroi]|uniref:Uncharacterized protein n=1 Tax=Ooceraea biroi TaxID=2015173 RepID=A0A026WCH6_OOCBI|nr:hypothetical protein X777_06887 [Ooceraea biroi]